MKTKTQLVESVDEFMERKANEDKQDREKERELRGRIVGRFLKASREKATLTQQQVAQHLSYSTAQFISNWERGVSLPPLDLMPKLAELYRVAPRTFLETLHRYQDELLKLQKRQLTKLFREDGPETP